jgi:hypothetical protein
MLVLITHDPCTISTLPLSPKGPINNWYAAGWKDKLHWSFLAKLPFDGKPGKYRLDGTYNHDIPVKSLDGSSTIS